MEAAAATVAQTPNLDTHFPPEILNKYTLIRELGHGAYGYVW